MSANTLTVKDRTRQYHKSRDVKPIEPMSKKELSSGAYYGLKWLAILFMIAFLAFIFIDKNIHNPHPDDTSMAVGIYGESGVYLNQVEIVPTPVKVILSIVGRMSFPLFAFLLVECFNHTHNKKRHLLRLFAIAVLSEVPWDYINSGEIWDIESQNVAVTLTLGFAMMMLFDLPFRDYLKQYKPKKAKDEKWLKRNEKILKIGIAGAVSGIALLLRCEYSWSAILLITMLSFTRSSEHRIKWTIFSFAAFVLAQFGDSIMSLAVFLLIPIVLLPLIYRKKTSQDHKSFLEKTGMRLTARCSYTVILMILCVSKIALGV